MVSIAKPSYIVYFHHEGSYRCYAYSLKNIRSQTVLETELS